MSDFKGGEHWTCVGHRERIAALESTRIADVGHAVHEEASDD